MVVTACGSLGPLRVEAQPVIEGEDIVAASDELREVLYERYELQQDLKRLRRETEQLEARLEAVEELVTLQKRLDSARAELEKADEERRAEAAEEWERQALQIEASIERRREALELVDYAEHVSFLSEIIGEQEDDVQAQRIAARLSQSADAIKELRVALRELEEAREDDDQRQQDSLETQIDELRDRIASDEELIELVSELVDAMEEEEEEHATELREEIDATLAYLEGGDESEESDAKRDLPIDPSLLPVAVTPEALARYEEVDFQGTVAPLLTQYCVDCHGNDGALGDLNIESLISQSPLVLHREKWINVIEQAKNRAMPPEDGFQPSDAEREELVLSLHNAIYNFDYSQIQDPGFESARRLTHEEYDNTVGDLFGVEVDLAKNFPSDLAGRSGFDNSANTLFIQPILMERYMWAADEIVATLLPDAPQTERQRVAYRTVFRKDPASTNGEVDPQAILKRFAARAFRRPLSDQERKDLDRQYRSASKEELPPREAIKSVLRTTLISPNFLLKSESAPRSDEDHRVSDWELASRLSYFLWASMPDDELFRLAASGKLQEPQTLARQVDRMIEDPRSLTLGSVFAAQWLGSQHVGTTVRLDPIDNPWCTDSLMEAMRSETAMFFHGLVQENEPIARLIDADFTYLNNELSKHYRISGVRGDQMRRVSLEDDRRGGILGQGSLLAVTSFPYRTSPVVRGKWILDTLLGTPPPPPP
ncbi:MAG: DUF1592 domain-containing protein, partial [Planctomycetota bacterium]